MRHLRRLDPRLNPSLRPHEWESALRRHRFTFAALGMLTLGALLVFAIYLWYPFDRTRALTPEQIAQSAGLALLESGGYKFTVELTGDSKDKLFPTMELTGQYQKSPQALHLTGKAVTGEAEVALAYYLEGTALYVKHPTNPTWVLLHDAVPDELASFFPDNLAAPLVSGVRDAEIVQKGRLPGGDAVQLLLHLDPEVMLPHAPALHQDKTEYRLWVYTKNLRPARFTMSVVPPKTEGEQERTTTYFTYSLDLDFTQLSPVIVPPEVKEGAQVIEEARQDRGEGPPRPPEQLP